MKKPGNDWDNSGRIAWGGNRYTTRVIPTRTSAPSATTITFPVSVSVAGTTMGPLWCNSCTASMPQGNSVCMYCKGELTSYRQHILAEAIELNASIVDLVPEPENPYDSSAVAVYLRFPKRRREHVGYLPAKQHGDSNHVLAKDILPFILKNKPLYVTAQVTGGHFIGEGVNYGLRLTITDKA